MHAGKMAMIGALIAPAAASLAQDIGFSPEPTEACLAAAPDEPGRVACIGQAADACIGSPDGSTTVGMGFCLGQEADFWGGRLNAAYGGLMWLDEAAAKELVELESAAPSPAAALRDLPRAWIGYRDAASLYAASQWGGGTGAGPAAAACALQITGREALRLERLLAERQAR